MTEYEVQRALLSNDPHDQLNIAYHLIVDNRRLAGEGKNMLFSKSPIKKSSQLVENIYIKSRFYILAYHDFSLQFGDRSWVINLD